ncbi:hypothetical protein [Agriterribacter sp.]|uniref:hypothetical protein n=1 Tax=Agriterribacter sp. TaxID=2821509 RepID=UPI002CC7DA7B|nr:hypothetical protein [Agriterribacter sp.]HRP56372.1 hypothetical protein [Agriterribacter sp.]
MPENDFEKQVQQLFNDMRLKPSAEVWPKVSDRIRKGKSRKRAFAWLPLALLLLGGGGYWLLQNNDNPLPSDHITKTAPVPGNDNRDISSKESRPVPENTDDISKTDQQKINIEVAPSAGNKAAGGNLNNDGSGSGSHASNGQRNSVKSPVNIQALDNTKQRVQPAVQLPVPDNAGNHNAIAGKKNEATHSIPGSRKENMTYTNGLEPFNSINKNLVSTPLTGVLQSVEKGSSLLPGIETKKILNDIAKGNIPEAPVKLAKKKAWEWGISGGAGMSSVGDGLSDLFGNTSAEKSLLNALPNAPNMTNNIGFLTGQNSMVAALPPPASPVKSGMAWQAGAFAKWKVTSRLAITGGLQYRYYSTKRAVGNDINNYRLALGNTQNDANASYAGYYVGRENINYTNRYHFIEIPAGVEWQLNKAAKFPLLLNGGLSLSWLANTTAVHYHGQTGSYYKDRTLFNKMHAGIYAGISAKLFANSRRPLYIGPVVQYNLTNLLKPSVNPDQHFMYTGLKAEWVLFKK